MSAESLVLALLLLAICGAVMLRWISQRHADDSGVGDKALAHKGRLRLSQNASGSAVRRRGSKDENGSDQVGVDDGNGGAVGRRRRGAGGDLRRRRPQERGANPHHGGSDGDENSYDDDDTGGIPETDANGVKLTRLQRKKLAKEREREERRQAQEAALEAQRQRTDANELRDAEAARREEELKAAEEAALQQLRRDKKKAEDEEYAKWVSHIGVEERGELGDEERERQTRLQSFLLGRAAQVQARAQRSAAGAKSSPSEEECIHVLILQTAARDLKVSVEELVSTIEQLSQADKVHGVFDDRGKYVFIAPEQFPLLAQFIRLRGRVSVQEFTRECNRIVMQS
ncbi:hypothetical protein, conserved [Leishmania donovani]|uniref:DDRGK domain containing protein, putative n=1 Tax=Leishmania donovani TaxID=5661 RepID=A0A3S5H536_LEIDO|nr:hypothetical protein, conserved [Leishmania donovani]AYU75708.1 DDRGK domain containing protein, putative [Leishmania donovani]TPP53984.1 DDRGK domain family protein [Leishmania donovani]CBZ31273.1 hypothetical protein, conserved [Leishmania donovani]